jgi:O-6-methylguanine DNA methyltransferase|tara:strand:- start:148 stop:630 length:483 start_codon:yes stop_codon:yes gene_type:complete
VNSTLIETGLGEFRVQYTKQGLARLQFPQTRIDPASNTIASSKQWINQTKRALHAVLNGKIPKISPPLDLSSGTDFQREVWTLLQSIPTGQVEAYGELAYRLNKPKAARAVGGACGANPIPVLIPCHRVVGANGSLTGFSAGINWKIRLLRIEGVELPLH